MEAAEALEEAEVVPLHGGIVKVQGAVQVGAGCWHRDGHTQEVPCRQSGRAGRWEDKRKRTCEKREKGWQFSWHISVTHCHP